MRFRTEQPPYSMLARRIETSVLPVCPRLGMGVLTWSPLAWGFLSGKYGTGRDPDVTAARPALARTASIRHGRPTRPSSRPPGSSLTRPVSARPA
jgi:aryl-alcohol dehydrogenase-like predicted oxidoreductase